MPELEPAVEIQLGGAARRLVPTLRATRLINRRFGDFRIAQNAITNCDTEAYVFIVRVGLGLSDGAQSEVDEQVWSAGVLALRPALISYTDMLLNGGQPLSAEKGAGPAGGAGEP